MASGGLRRPVGKVLELADGPFLPSLVWEHRRLNLGSHASKEVAEACYDAAKLLLVRKLGGDDAPFEGLKLHRPATSYTSHPLWADLTGPHCSFEEACSLLAGGAAEDLLAAPAACRALRHKRAPADAAIVGQQLEKERRSKLQRQEQPADAAQSSCAQCGAVNAAAGQQGLCGACSRAVPGQPAAAAAAVQRSGGGGGDTAADGQQNAAAPAAGQKFRQTTWSGLEPSDCGTYSVRLPRSVWDGKCGIISAPARYAQAVFGGASGEVTLILAGCGRQFSCNFAFKPNGKFLSGLRPPLQALGVAAGDQLCFTPAGRGTATISLRKAGTEAGTVPASNSVGKQAAAAEDVDRRSKQAAAAEDANRSNTQSAAAPEAGKVGRQQAIAQLFESDSE